MIDTVDSDDECEDEDARTEAVLLGRMVAAVLSIDPILRPGHSLRPKRSAGR